jgi:hypothetical protein
MDSMVAPPRDLVVPSELVAALFWPQMGNSKVGTDGPVAFPYHPSQDMGDRISPAPLQNMGPKKTREQRWARAKGPALRTIFPSKTKW